MSASSSCVTQARDCYVKAEKACRQDEKYSLYVTASKLYLQAAPTVSDTELKRSLVYLSQACAHKAALAKQCSATSTSAQTGSPPTTHSETALALQSQRLIHLAHMQQLERLQNVPARLAANAVQVVRDLLSLETALANIGFKNPSKSNNNLRSPSSEQLLQSTFAFNSDLGESFMVLDPRTQPHGASVHDAARHGGPRVTYRATDPRDLQHRPVRPAGSSSSGTDTHAPPHTRNQPSQQGRDPAQERRRHHVRVEIENELNDPMVQSYLTTHASPMARSQFDFDNVTQSTMSTFNKDTIDNEQGVLNLLQTVRRIGDENAQLLLKIESLKHLDERSAVVYRDIEQFKEDFTDQFESLKELLTEYAKSISLSKAPSASEVRASTSTATPGTSAGAGVPPPQPPQDLLSSIIHKELGKAKTAAASSAAAVRTVGVVPAAASSGGGGIGIAGAHKPPEDESPEALQRRKQQLEVMVKSLVQRVEKAAVEARKKDDLLEKYLRVINKFQQQQRPSREVSETGEMDVSAMSIASAHEGDRRAAERERDRDRDRERERERAGGPPSGRERADPYGQPLSQQYGSSPAYDAAAMAAKSGGVISTYRRAPLAESVPSVGSPPQSSHAEVSSPSGALTSPAPVPVPSMQRTPSGGYRPGVIAASPRTKNSSAMTLEVLQRNAHPPTPPKK